jgi:hypothetical protein
VFGGGIVRKATDVDHGADRVEESRGEAPHVSSHQSHAVAEALNAEIAEEEAIEYGDVVAALQKLVHQYTAEVAGATDHQHGFGHFFRLHEWISDVMRQFLWRNR